jgi:hypothetical protein
VNWQADEVPIADKRHRNGAYFQAFRPGSNPGISRDAFADSTEVDQSIVGRTFIGPITRNSRLRRSSFGSLLVDTRWRRKTVGLAWSGRHIMLGPIGEGMKQVVDRPLVLDLEPSSVGGVRLLVQILLHRA